MKIKLIVVGKTNVKYLKDGENEYEKRLKHYVKFEELVVGDVKNARNLNHQELKKKEGSLILSKIENIDFVVLLDDKGKMFSSYEFSNFIDQKILRSTKSLVFVVGGAFGFSDEVVKRANIKLSLSKMTFSHQMVRMIFKEQLYRAFTILKGEKYHHD
ncbi:MAG: 23S rRNA (pseudouridine(1915)-N(3))-methyltransferase RlmH [Crocinitomicaceae bacterium]|nr:23S rRNA (pseudouridine(1915)-N(3))-methyltransferase RlmH [Crocinitomicaceae bacterium]